MGFEDEKLSEFLEHYKSIPNISNLGVHNKIKAFLKGEMPALNEYMRAGLKSYLPQPVWSSFNKLTDAVIDEIDRNVAIVVPDKSLPRYFEYLVPKIEKIVFELTNTTWLQEIDNFDLTSIDAKIKTLDPTQLDDCRLIQNLLWRDNRYYPIMYGKVLEHVKLILRKEGILYESIKANPITLFFEQIKQNRHQIDESYQKLSSRERLLILKYAVDAGLEPYPIPADIRRNSNNDYKQFYTVFSEGKKKKEPTRKELLHIIPHLSKQPQALSLAEAALAKLD